MSGVGDFNNRFANLVQQAGISAASIAALRSPAPIIPAEIASPKIAKTLVDMGYQAADFAFSFNTAVAKKSATKDSTNDKENDSPKAENTNTHHTAKLFQIKKITEKESSDPEHKNPENLIADRAKPKTQTPTMGVNDSDRLNNLGVDFT